jgi:hypothetical protein
MGHDGARWGTMGYDRISPWPLHKRLVFSIAGREALSSIGVEYNRARRSNIGHLPGHCNQAASFHGRTQTNSDSLRWGTMEHDKISPKLLHQNATSDSRARSDPDPLRWRTDGLFRERQIRSLGSDCEEGRPRMKRIAAAGANYSDNEFQAATTELPYSSLATRSLVIIHGPRLMSSDVV